MSLDPTPSEIMPVPARTAAAHWLGEGIDYGWALELQHELAARRAANEIPDTLLLLGHAPVYTAGRRSLPGHVLRALNAPLIETDRGGQVTYHGPGQLVGYPIVALAPLGLGPRRYIEALERMLIEVLAEWGVGGWREEGLTGVWTDRGKIAAIGVRIARGVAMHGFALNVSTEPDAYGPIVPCGIADRPVTSMAHLLAEAPAVGTLARAAVGALGRHLGIDWRIG